jgi:WD40 repeat protein
VERHQTKVNGLAFAPDGLTLGSCSHDGAVRLWHEAPRPASDAIQPGADQHALAVGGAHHLPHAGNR